MSDSDPSKPARSIGRKSIRPTLVPRDLMSEDPELAKAWSVQVITLFPDAFPGVLGQSLTGKALKDGVWQLRPIDLRLYGEGKHRNVDDTPAGGGAGMVLRADVVGRALADARAAARGRTPMIYLSPRGKPFDQAMARNLARTDGVILLCGRFEGVDQRVLDHFGIEEVSIGDFVLTGGEIAAQAMIDATVRLLPGVLGNAASVEEESHSNGLLEHPQYTRPAEWMGQEIPPVLMSGNHGEIAKWRRAQSEALTRARRPDMWVRHEAEAKPARK
ncbi:tRNA (guanosine(37)-N1)-methyltransferase TrmD [Ponticoccus sp. SC2-23]|uniref:tRNA (guanosine(37)-N1)-methyltransferase TrmD n=1 Tax=Alexandriicola marinus TaxID=2081710 RepID=UPI000FD6EB83|nr:tRNA (guanosine(37)-N1)-methyltransferase TrmD [Alexandriicola marinus]MBM1220323.1 tRNA (guanosine(37)-N1)-methyltransferase TrmD [Ponticoccus sp. SC6-9]MBM1225009.1 tRNA (guanosine(37)-N1)-methyltransferase TrmD [Ponticoccus sp. SC6-15]MBM1228523.1 tRNA (guanosine(37)-N1)-methyltransferase TrmD [Ponticoccus sp. SC6-38]MBM1233840.1 tRNA (guanosine(37)-N1)-methyltransferase TrmD [Ponticoccus sp. SC6-45]MBM1239024.1 tRNA (guanosine(37)-N1)-methyltransferase TrmD [Ponticoccus sp. SC6-49]MBM1